MVVELDLISLENIHGYMVVLYVCGHPTLLILLLLDKSLGYQSDHKNHETLIVNLKKCAL